MQINPLSQDLNEVGALWNSLGIVRYLLSFCVDSFPLQNLWSRGHIGLREQLKDYFRLLQIKVKSCSLLCHIQGKQHAAHSGHMDQNSSTELMVEIYSKSLVRAVDKVLLMKFSLNTS